MSCGHTAALSSLVTDYFVVQVLQSVYCVCVYQYVFAWWPSNLAWWFTVPLSRSCSWVKVRGQSEGHKRKGHLLGWNWKEWNWKNQIPPGRKVELSANCKSTKRSVRPRVGVFQVLYFTMAQPQTNSRISGHILCTNLFHSPRTQLLSVSPAVLLCKRLTRKFPCRPNKSVRTVICGDRADCSWLRNCMHQGNGVNRQKILSHSIGTTPITIGTNAYI